MTTTAFESNLALRLNLKERRDRWLIYQAFCYDALGLIVPATAPLVPAGLTASAIASHYPDLFPTIPLWFIYSIAGIAALVIELLGVLAIETMFDMRRFNLTLKEGEEHAPFTYAVLAVVFYLALVLALVLLLKIYPSLSIWSLGPLTVLGFITSWVMVLRKQHTEREFKRDQELVKSGQKVVSDLTSLFDQERAELQKQIAELTSKVDNLTGEIGRLHGQSELDRSKLEQAQLLIDQLKEQTVNQRIELARLEAVRSGQPNPVKSDQPSTSKVDPIKEQIKILRAENPEISRNQLAKIIGVSGGTITARLKELKEAAGGPSLNGNGVH